MDAVAVAALASWRLDPGTVFILLVAALVYVQGWRRLHRERPYRYPVSRLVAFFGGLATIFVALDSPLDAFGNLLLLVHMIQHLFLIMVAPPLILYSQPVLAMMRGLPRRWLQDGLGPFLTWPLLRRIGRGITHPVVCWIAMAWAIVFWHIPALYELGLKSQTWHQVQHGCFFWAAMLFWWPVIQVWPSPARWPRGAMIPYLIAADIVNTALSAFLSFSDRVVYSSYLQVPRLAGITALQDQATAGAIMWVPGSIAFLLPAVILTMQLFNPRWGRPAGRQPTPSSANRPNVMNRPDQGVRRRPGGLPHSILLYPHLRRIAQSALFLLAVAVVIDGLKGTQVAPLNLAGILPWTYWRGLAVIALLIAGNLFCMACPFTLPRDLARRFFPPRYRWPAKLRSKWIAIALLAAYLWAYEALSLWNSPWWTAWIVIGYFVTALVVDSLFQGASFCKYVCPIGQFHFVQSFVSPLEVKVRQPQVCNTCHTHDCLHGNERRRGCELNLFQPTKRGNFDCTFCLDCVHACPQQNVAILPASSLLQDSRWYKRRDVTALLLLLVIGAFVNAAGMTGPIMMWMQEQGAMSSFYYAAALLLPAAAMFWGVRGEETSRFVLALVPLGFSMWLAHFSFHLVSSFAPAAAWLTPAEILALDCGLLASLYLAWRISDRAFGRFAPWATFAVALYSFGIWILFQPMQMRGMVMN